MNQKDKQMGIDFGACDEFLSKFDQFIVAQKGNSQLNTIREDIKKQISLIQNSESKAISKRIADKEQSKINEQLILLTIKKDLHQQKIANLKATLRRKIKRFQMRKMKIDENQLNKLDRLNKK